MRNIYKVIFSVDEFAKVQDHIYHADSIEKNFEEYQDIFKLLDRIQVEPKNDSINKILDFAKKNKK